MTSPSKKLTESHDVVHGLIGPLQLAIHVVQNRHTGTQKSPWDKTNKGNYHLIKTMYCMSFVGLAPVRLFRPSMAVLYHVNGKLQLSDILFIRSSMLMKKTKFCKQKCYFLPFFCPADHPVAH